MSRPRPTQEASIISSLLGPSVLAPMLIVAAVPALAQSALPVAQPTANMDSASGSNQVASTGQILISKPQPKLEVAYVAGNLTVDATHASLNQVLREVALRTGMKVSGSVADETVFGHYGPLPLAEVLASLLAGTGSNMLLVDNKNGAPELVLTPRRGGVTPPNPNATVAGNEEREQPQQYVPPSRPFQPPIPSGRGPVGANSDGSPAFIPPSQNVNADDAPRTPQQIYEQLQSQSPPLPPPVTPVTPDQ